MKAALALVAAALLFLVGCAHTESFESSMNRQVNILTYDDAIQTWGPPSSEAFGDRVIVASWRKTARESVAFRSGHAFISSKYVVLTVTFSKDTKRMTAWSLE